MNSQRCWEMAHQIYNGELDHTGELPLHELEMEPAELEKLTGPDKDGYGISRVSRKTAAAMLDYVADTGRVQWFYFHYTDDEQLDPPHPKPPGERNNPFGEPLTIEVTEEHLRAGAAGQHVSAPAAAAAAGRFRGAGE